jgi:hypothetical protein
MTFGIQAQCPANCVCDISELSLVPILHCTLDDVNTPNTHQECNCLHKQDPVQMWYALKINVSSIVLDVSTWHVGCDCNSAALGIAH